MYLEYTYYGLLCRQKLRGHLDTAERRQAQSAIEQGHFLAEHVPSNTDFTLRFTGYLHLLCGEFVQAIPCLQLVRPQESGIDRLAVDQALFACYVQTRQFAKARELLTSGAATAGVYAHQYEVLLERLAALEKARPGENRPQN